MGGACNLIWTVPNKWGPFFGGGKPAGIRSSGRWTWDGHASSRSFWYWRREMLVPWGTVKRVSTVPFFLAKRQRWRPKPVSLSLSLSGYASL